MKRTFEIEWPDELGPLWMNRDNLLLVLTETCRGILFTVRDTTGDGNCDPRPESSQSGPRPVSKEQQIEQAFRVLIEHIESGRELPPIAVKMAEFCRECESILGMYWDVEKRLGIPHN